MVTTDNTPQDVPVFLRKTYHMIDSCDPTVAGWSEDGETFVVKDPIKFEKVIIPQFFKHSKFSSFVRQLNFYSFRKIKFVDSIRIDTKLEAETANFWRFRHESFRRGRPDLLSEIKRMNAKTAAKSESNTGGVATPSAAVDSEVQALKKRIEEMNKNIDHLTAMVEKVNLKQEEHEKEEMETYIVGNKRKKILLADPFPEPGPVDPIPEPQATAPEPMEVTSALALDDLEAAPLPPTLPLPDVSPVSHRELSNGTNSTDSEFVDQLFKQFGDDEVEFLQLDEPHLGENRPDPELMQRLSDALMVLPKEIQEMIVERLIESITSPSFLKANGATIPSESSQTPVVAADKVVPHVESMDDNNRTDDRQREAAVPLAAATLAALLQHLCQQAQDSGDKVPNTKAISKILPVVPVHA